MHALVLKCNKNIMKLLINNKTDINQKNNFGKTSLKILLGNYSEKNIVLILFLFYSVNKKINSTIISIYNDSIYKYF